jgi:hypothetical protein
MVHRITVLRPGRLAPRSLGAAIVAAALWVTCICSAGTANAASCPGRFLFTCAEKQAIVPDAFTWLHLYELDFEMFETKTSLPLWNPALRTFWRFEATSAAARGDYEEALGSELIDSNFETLATVPRLSRPSVRAAGVVNRRLARSLSHLMQAEQREVGLLDALDTAMNRATFARYNGSRKDWVAWQEASAAGFASRAAGAIGQVITDQRAVARGLVAKKLLFGVGVEDLRLAQRRVRHHGLAGYLVGAMRRLGLTPHEIVKIKQGFLGVKPTGLLSFSLSEQLSAPNVLAKERNLQRGLRAFAARIPPAGRPPS